jgi:ferredoxin-NADP reductase
LPKTEAAALSKPCKRSPPVVTSIWLHQWAISSSQKTLLFVAAGIGCTPFHSIIKYLQDHEESRDITLLYGVHNLEQVAFRDTFEKLGDHWHLVLDAPPPEWQGYTGHITTEIILENITEPEKQQVYISGPEPMVETLTKELDASGFPKNHIRTDYFPGYTEV